MTWPVMEARIGQVIAGAAGNVAVSVRDLRTGEHVSMGATQPITTASVNKIAALVELLRQVDAGQQSLDTSILVTEDDWPNGGSFLKEEGLLPATFTLGQLATYMIQRSDNTSTNVVMSTVGRDNIRATLTGLELDPNMVTLTAYTRTEPGRRWVVNAWEYTMEGFATLSKSTPAEVTALLAAVWSGGILSAESRAYFLNTLYGTTDQSKLRGGLPTSTPLSHKAGSNTGTAVPWADAWTGWQQAPGISNDAGILMIPGHEYAVAVFTEGDNLAGSSLIRDISGIVFDGMVGGSATRPVTAIYSNGGRTRVGDSLLNSQQAAPGSLVAAQPPGVGVRTKTWNQSLCLYNGESPALWQIVDATREGRTGGKRKRLTFTGMSKIAGWPADEPNSIAELGLPASLIRLLGARPGLIHATTRDSRWTFTGGITDSADTFRNWSDFTTGAWTATFKSVHPFTGFRPVIYAGQSTRTVTVTVDGQTLAPFTVTGGSAWRAQDYTGLTNTTHTVTLSGTSSGMMLQGIDPLYSTGLSITNAGRPSSTAANWTPTGTTSSWSQNFAVTFASETGASTLSKPDGVLIGTGLNGSTPAQIGQAIDAAVAQGAPVALIAFGGTGVHGSGTHDAQRVAIYDAADRHDLAVVDFTALIGWSAEGQARGLIRSDAVHETANGYKAEAALLARILAP